MVKLGRKLNFLLEVTLNVLKTWKKSAILLCFMTALPTLALAEATASQVKNAASVSELEALGATMITANQFQSMIVGKTLDEGSWTWVVNADGTQGAVADDKSWQDTNGTWEMKGDKFCRKSKEYPKLNCSDVYVLGKYVRMTAGKGLSDWTLVIK
jgi:hypothetical protein